MLTGKNYLTTYGTDAKVYIEAGQLWVENTEGTSRPLEPSEIRNASEVLEYLKQESAAEALPDAAYINLTQIGEDTYSVDMNLRLLGGGTCMSTPGGLLLAAADAGNITEVKRLLASGIPIDSCNRYGRTALSTAAKNGNIELVKFLIAAGANVRTNSALRQAAAYSDSPETIKLLLDAGADVNAVDKVGSNSLVLASGNPPYVTKAKQNPEIVRMLIEAGAELDCQPHHIHQGGYTPLHKAVLNANTAIARLLLEAGARTDIRDGEGKTAFELAIKYKRAGIIELFRSPPPRVDYVGIAAAKRAAEAAEQEKAEAEAMIERRIAINPEGYSQTLLKIARTSVRQLFEDIEDETRQETVQATLHRFLLTSEHVKRAGVDLPDDPSHAANRASLVTQLVTDLKAKKYLWKGRTFDADEMVDELKSSVLLWSEKMKSGAAERSRLERIEDRLTGLSMGGGGSAGPAGAGTGAGAPGFATTFAQNAGKAAGMEAGKRIGLAVVRSLF
jgi:ankyrin repeat protein